MIASQALEENASLKRELADRRMDDWQEIR